jgi:transcriptional regulator with XRE-family HTH domain
MYKEFGKNLKRLRIQKGFKQEALALKLGIDRTTLSRWERGEREPDLETQVKIADLLRIPLDELFGRKPVDYLNFAEDIPERYVRESAVYNDSLTAEVADTVGKVRKMKDESRRSLLIKSLENWIAMAEDFLKHE